MMHFSSRIQAIRVQVLYPIPLTFSSNTLGNVFNFLVCQFHHWYQRNNNVLNSTQWEIHKVLITCAWSHQGENLLIQITVGIFTIVKHNQKSFVFPMYILQIHHFRGIDFTSTLCHTINFNQNSCKVFFIEQYMSYIPFCMVSRTKDTAVLKRDNTRIHTVLMRKKNANYFLL